MYLQLGNENDKSRLVLYLGMGIESRFQVRTGYKLSDPLELYASKLVNSFIDASMFCWQSRTAKQ